MTELDRRHRLLVLMICCSSLFVVGMDTTIVHLALPSIRTDFGASVTALQWTVDAYTLTLASLLLLAGATADRLGRRRVFQTGLVLFGIGSLLCSLAPSADALVGFRVVQAVGGAMLNPVALSIVANVFTDPRDLARAIGVWASVLGLSMTLGPVVGGALVDSVGWRAVFWLNIPVVVVAVVATARFIPESRASRARRLDPLGQILITIVLGGLTFAIIEFPVRGVGSAVVGAAVAAVLALVAFIPWELRRADPLIDPRFFRSAPFTGATLIAISAFAAMSGFLFLSALYLQTARGFTPLYAGLLMLPMAIFLLVAPVTAGRIIASRGPRIPLVVGGLGMGAAGAVLLGLRIDTPLWQLIAAYVLFGIGLGTINPPITNTAVSGMPAAQAGVASAVASTSRQVGAALGVAVIGSSVTAAIRGSLAEGLPAASHIGWAVIVGCGTVIVMLALVTTSRWARRTAERTASTMAVREALVRVTVRPAEAA